MGHLARTQSYLTRLTNQVVIRVIRVQILTCIALLAAEFWLTVLSLAWHDDLYKVSNVYIGDAKAKRVSTGEKIFLSQSNSMISHQYLINIRINTEGLLR